MGSLINFVHITTRIARILTVYLRINAFNRMLCLFECNANAFSGKFIIEYINLVAQCATAASIIRILNRYTYLN